MTIRAKALASAVVAAILIAAPASGLAGDRPFRRSDDDRGFHHHGRDHRRPTVLLHPGVPGRIYPPGVRFGLVPPIVGYGPRTYVPPPRIYYDYDVSAYPPPPPPYVPDASVSMVPPGPSVVEYPTGRYELRGDGVTRPYAWEWVPKTPPAPPMEPPPPPPPASADPEPAEPRRQTEMYRWTDDAGAVHWTDRWDAVPERYRSTVTKSKS